MTTISVPWEEFWNAEQPPAGEVVFEKKPWTFVKQFQLKLLRLQKDNCVIVAKLRKAHTQSEWPEVWNDAYDDPDIAEAMQHLIIETLQEILVSASGNKEKLSKEEALETLMLCGTQPALQAIVAWANKSKPTLLQSL